ncbi:MAG: hypothetical protein HY364_01540 [Candidatus Aenigmarchaeota archaeon]|nr:hypothetical protein [Candidatus Aenigmarchaeota archaeon]
MEYKTTLAILAVAVSLASYVPYFLNIFRNRTKPHVFSWFIWGLLTAIAFFAQIEKNAGAGAWVTGVTAATCFAISSIAFLKSGISYVKKSDWLCLVAALAGIVIWKITSDPLSAVIIVTLVDILGFIPTFRKAYYEPYSETVITFAAGSVTFALSILAFDNLELTTWLYPASLVVANAIFVMMVLLRRTIKWPNQSSAIFPSKEAG